MYHANPCYQTRLTWNTRIFNYIDILWNGLHFSLCLLILEFNTILYRVFDPKSLWSLIVDVKYIFLADPVPFKILHLSLCCQIQFKFSPLSPNVELIIVGSFRLITEKSLENRVLSIVCIDWGTLCNTNIFVLTVTLTSSVKLLCANQIIN